MKTEDLKFYRCKHCGNLVQMVHASGVPLICCGEPMEELTPNTTDAAQEKHVPVASVQDGALHVAVGSVAHPMAEEHYIEWIAVETAGGFYRKALAPGEAPEADFTLGGEQAKAVYAYCNLHGLWKADV